MNPWLEGKGWLQVKEWFKGQVWLRRRSTWIIVSLVILSIGFAMARQAEHRKRIATEQELAQTIQGKELVEAKLSAEEQHSRELSQALEMKANEVVQVVKRLEEEAQTVERLQGRLIRMERQMSQIQAELVLSVRNREELTQRVSESSDGAAIELEKVTVSGPKPESIEGRIIQVDVDWQFVVVDLGWALLSVGDVLGVYRDDAFIAKVQIERVQEEVAAARILPEFRAAHIVMDDRVAEL